MSDPMLINTTTLYNLLQHTLSIDGLCDTIHQFDIDGRRLLLKLSAALVQPTESPQYLLHQLRSLSGSIGALQLQTYCGDYEESTDSLFSHAPEEALQRLSDLHAKSVLALQHYVNRTRSLSKDHSYYQDDIFVGSIVKLVSPIEHAPANSNAVCFYSRDDKVGVILTTRKLAWFFTGEIHQNLRPTDIRISKLMDYEYSTDAQLKQDILQGRFNAALGYLPQNGA